MKRILFIFIFAVLCLSAFAQGVSWHDASGLTIIGKPIPTSKPFTRIDGSVYKFNDKTIDLYAGYSTGLAILFETDSKVIKARWTTGQNNASKNMTAIVCKGLDLYIMNPLHEFRLVPYIHTNTIPRHHFQVIFHRMESNHH